MKDMKRDYQNKMNEKNRNQFEIGNELGAELEKNKMIHEHEYQKKSIQQNKNEVNKSSNKNKNS